MRYQFIVGVLSVILLSGCTTAIQRPTASSHLQTKVSEMEIGLVEKDQQIADLKYEIKELSSELKELDSIAQEAQQSAQKNQKYARSYRRESTYQEPDYYETAPVKKRPAIKVSSSSKDDKRVIRVSASPNQVQKALKNAGYYTGTVDGKFGKNSKKALSQFQKDHNLKADGIVGRKTWSSLQSYL